jgi:alpha-aminoadipic semialdehyde synthase
VPRLQVIGDISCDIGGGVELTVKATMPDEPCFVWDPATGLAQTGFAGAGPVIMAVDNLPCELPRESSEYFSAVLRELVPSLAACDYSRPFAELDLPDSLRRAVITHRGELTPDYQYLRGFLEASRRGE